MQITDYRKQYLDLVCANAHNSIESDEYQIHHIKPLSLGGDNSRENLVALSPKDHIFAHELLFKYYAGCAKSMARMLISTAGSKYAGIRSADELPDSINADYITARRMVSKRSILNVTDMSERRIGYFDPTPDGYIEKPVRENGQRGTRIFNEAKLIMAPWLTGCDVPEGWKLWSRVEQSVRDAYYRKIGKPTSQQRKLAAQERLDRNTPAYDPFTLKTGIFEKNSIPEGWVVGRIPPPEEIVKIRIGGLKSGIKYGKSKKGREDAERRLETLNKMIESGDFSGIYDDSRLCGLYKMDGKRMFLRNWAEKYGMKLEKLRKLIKDGWTLEQAIGKAERKRTVDRTATIGYNGETLTFAEASEKYGISVDILACRRRKKWTPEEMVEIPENGNRLDYYRDKFKQA